MIFVVCLSLLDWLCVQTQDIVGNSQCTRTKARAHKCNICVHNQCVKDAMSDTNRASHDIKTLDGIVYVYVVNTVQHLHTVKLFSKRSRSRIIFIFEVS